MGGYPIGAEYNYTAPYNLDDYDEEDEYLDDWYKSEAEDREFERHRFEAFD